MNVIYLQLAAITNTFTCFFLLSHRNTTKDYSQSFTQGRRHLKLQHSTYNALEVSIVASILVCNQQYQRTGTSHKFRTPPDRVGLPGTFQRSQNIGYLPTLSKGPVKAQWSLAVKNHHARDWKSIPPKKGERWREGSEKKKKGNGEQTEEQDENRIYINISQTTIKNPLHLHTHTHTHTHTQIQYIHNHN